MRAALLPPDGNRTDPGRRRLTRGGKGSRRVADGELRFASAVVPCLSEERDWMVPLRETSKLFGPNGEPPAYFITPGV